MSISYIKKTRENFLSVLDDKSHFELNHIPKGYNNNLIWNLGHIISSQQVLCYQLSDLPFVVDKQLVDTFRKGTRPERVFSLQEYDEFKRYIFSTIDQLEMDINSRKFTRYTPFTTSYGLELKSIEDAVNFISIHDSLHLGYIMALKRAVKNELVGYNAI